MKQSRREFIKTNAIAATAAAGPASPSRHRRRVAVKGTTAVCAGTRRHRFCQAPAVRYWSVPGWPRGCHQGRSGCAGQSWPELHHEAISCPKIMYGQGSHHAATAAREEWQVRQPKVISKEPVSHPRPLT